MGALIPRISAALCLVIGVSVQPVIARDKPLTSVADLRYGVSLYHYHLDEYLPALTELMIAESRDGIQGHGDNPEIMEGGLAMGYGMERYASDIFDRLLEQNRSVDVRDAAWFYLARLRYAHGEWDRTEEALDKISEEPTKLLSEEATALRINTVLKQDRPAEAALLLEQGNVATRWLPYFNFNIGSAFARAGDYEQAIGYFDYLSSTEYLREEHRALFDKAMTGAGFSLLFLKRYAESKEYFSRVRLNSNLKSRALLGYGWAAAEMGDYEEALKPWMYLANSDLVDENNQEAMIAVPYAYEKMNAEGLALTHYQNAESSFLVEIEKIDDVLASLKNEDLLAALEIEARGHLDWMSFAEEKQLSPRLAYLVRLFSQDSFQGSVQELQDLLSVRDSLVDWQEKLAFYSDMLDDREAFRGEQSEHMEITELKVRIKDMMSRRAEYADRIETIVADKDFFALATEDEQDLIKRVKRGERNVELLRESDPFIDEYEESVRRYKGLLLWQANETFSDRLWQATKTLKKLDETLESVSTVETNISNIMSTAPDLDPYRIKMNEANNKLAELNIRIDEAISRNESDLKGRVIDVLNQQRRRLVNYLAQSRLAVARIYDKARNTQEEEEFEKLKQEAEAAKQVLKEEALNNGEGLNEDKLESGSENISSTDEDTSSDDAQSDEALNSKSIENQPVESEPVIEEPKAEEVQQ